MYYWAEIDNDGTVLRLMPSIEDSNGDDGYIAITSEYPGKWIKASKNAATSGFRKNFPGPGYTYDESLDAFIPPKPYDSWTLNLEEFRWDPPTEYPNDGRWTWNENQQSWI